MWKVADSADANKVEGTDGQEIRLSARLSKMHLAASAVLIASILLGTFWLAKEHNRQAANYTEQMIQAKLTSFEKRLRGTNRDYSVWTEAYDAILEHDIAWLYSNIGTGAAEIEALDLIVLVPPGTAEPFGWRAGSPEIGEPDLLPPALIEEMLALLVGTPPSERIVKSAYAMLGGETWLLTVTRVIPVDGVPANVADAELPRQIQGIRIENTLLREIKDSFILQEVSITDSAAPGERSRPIELINTDETIGIVWTAPTPGTEILARAALPLAFVILAFVTVALLISRYSTRAARRLEHALVEAKAADRAKTQFLGVVSHELRTPMNGIIGLGQLLQGEELGPRERTLLTTMMNCAYSQMRIIEALLDIVQIESGRRSLHVAAFNPGTVLRDVAEVARLQCEKKGLAFELEGESDGATVLGDEQALRQIVTNLVDNAIKFTESGGVKVRANATPIGRESLEYRISVIDTGMGIEPSNHARIFQHLTQLDSSATRCASGLGLGLSICRSLSEMMGGQILVESELGSGSSFTFVVTLPVAERLSARIAA